jgi:hypothetical protein
MPAERINWEAKAAVAWPALVDVARNSETITYKSLGDAIGVHQRSVRLVLDLIQAYCVDVGLPPLTAVVVSQTRGRPGSGFIAWDVDNLDVGFALVYGFDWRVIPIHFADLVRTKRSRRSLANWLGRRKRLATFIDESRKEVLHKGFSVTR